LRLPRAETCRRRCGPSARPTSCRLSIGGQCWIRLKLNVERPVRPSGRSGWPTQSLTDILPDGLFPVQSRSVGLLDFDGAAAAAAGNPQQVSLNDR
jgi:hypothetical protein